MASNYPTSLDAFTNPASTDAMDAAGVLHDQQHADLNDAVEALQAKVGVDASAVATSLEYRQRKFPLLVASALQAMPPASAYATLATRNSRACLEFDADTPEATRFIGLVPLGANLAGGLIIAITWTAATATSGTCRWGARVDRAGADMDTDTFGTPAEVDNTAPGTSGVPKTTEITLTTLDSLAAGEVFWLEVYRAASHTNDTMTGDSQLHLIEVRAAA